MFGHMCPELFRQRIRQLRRHTSGLYQQHRLRQRIRTGAEYLQRLFRAAVMHAEKRRQSKDTAVSCSAASVKIGT